MPYRTLGDYFNPAQTLAQAEQIKTQRQQRQLQQQLAPYQMQMAQLEPQIAQAKLNEQMLKIKQMKDPALAGSNILQDKDFTRSDALKLMAFGTPEQKESAQKYFDVEAEQQKRLVGIKFGKLDDETVDFYADKVRAEPSYISKFSARSPQRAQIAERVVKKSIKQGLQVPQIELQNKQFQGAVSSYNKQRKAFDATVKTSDEFLNDADRVLGMIASIRTNKPGWANKSLVQLKKLMGTTGVGEEEVILNELFSLSSAFMRTASDTGESVSELSAGMQKIQNDMNSPHSPLLAIEKRIRNQKLQVSQKVESRRKSLTNLEQQMKKYATFEKAKVEKKEKPNFEILAVE